jgi:hypothetical protein
MAHFVGDACQPLHVSRLHDGRTEVEHGVHSAYETSMVTSRRAQIIDGLDQALAGPGGPAQVQGHRAVAVAIVELMQRTVTRLPQRRSATPTFNRTASRICGTRWANPRSNAWPTVVERWR